MPPALAVWSPSYWTTREVSRQTYFTDVIYIYMCNIWTWIFEGVDWTSIPYLRPHSPRLLLISNWYQREPQTTFPSIDPYLICLLSTSFTAPPRSLCCSSNKPRSLLPMAFSMSVPSFRNILSLDIHLDYSFNPVVIVSNHCSQFFSSFLFSFEHSPVRGSLPPLHWNCCPQCHDYLLDRSVQWSILNPYWTYQ